MTHKATVEAFHGRFGGYFYQWKNQPMKNSRRPFCWGVRGPNLVAFLQAIQPHSITKEKHISLILKYMTECRGLPSDHPKKELAIMAMKELNRRGLPSARV